jgi:hypothetical protein
VAALLAARGMAKHVPGGEAVSHSVGGTKMFSGLGSVMKQAFNDIVTAHSRARAPASVKGKNKPGKSMEAGPEEIGKDVDVGRKH